MSDDPATEIRQLLAGIEEAEETIKRLKGIKKCPTCGSDVLTVGISGISGGHGMTDDIFPLPSVSVLIF